MEHKIKYRVYSSATLRDSHLGNIDSKRMGQRFKVGKLRFYLCRQLTGLQHFPYKVGKNFTAIFNLLHFKEDCLNVTLGETVILRGLISGTVWSFLIIYQTGLRKGFNL